MSLRRILVVWSGPESGTSANLFKALAKVLAERNEVREAANTIETRSPLRIVLPLIVSELQRWPSVVWCDAVILHSYAARSLPTVLLAWALRKRIIVVLWDAYPITVNGARLGGLYRRLFDRLEHFIVARATRIVIPTEDFRPFVRGHNVTVLPLWPSLPLVGRPRQARRPGQPIRLAFVGQAGLTRGLPQAVQRLKQEAPERFELHIFSPAPPDRGLNELAENVVIHARGYLNRADLIAALDEMDFGFISLHPGMGQPGFPSKTFDYVAAGLPVIYTGRPMPAYANLLTETGVGFALGDSPVDWSTATARASAGMPGAVRAFDEATKLTVERLEKAFF